VLHDKIYSSNPMKFQHNTQAEIVRAVKIHLLRKQLGVARVDITNVNNVNKWTLEGGERDALGTR
jgi:hypothetical protein